MGQPAPWRTSCPLLSEKFQSLISPLCPCVPYWYSGDTGESSCCWSDLQLQLPGLSVRLAFRWLGSAQQHGWRLAGPAAEAQGWGASSSHCLCDISGFIFSCCKRNALLLEAPRGWGKSLARWKDLWYRGWGCWLCLCIWETREERFVPGCPQDPRPPNGGQNACYPSRCPWPFLLLLPSISLLQPHLPPHCSSNTLGISPPQGLCTGWPLCLELSFPEYPLGPHPPCIQVSSQLSPLQRGLSDHSI